MPHKQLAGRPFRPKLDSRESRCADELAQVTNPKEFVARIADHITDNYTQLRTIRGIIQTTSLDRTVTKREEVTINQDNGSRVQFLREPSSVRRQRLLLSGVDMRREATDEAGEIWSFHRGVYTQYVPKAKTAWLRLPAQMPGIPPLDPRNIASLEQRWNFVDRLRGDRVIELVPARTADRQPRMAALMEHTFDQGRNERYRCEFDTARNDLPTRIVVFRDEDKIGIVLDIAYQEVIPRTAWFFEKGDMQVLRPRPCPITGIGGMETGPYRRDNGQRDRQPADSRRLVRGEVSGGYSLLRRGPKFARLERCCWDTLL